MVSKNNSYQKLCQDADRVPHYGLRKLSVGVASVLLSTTLYLGVNAQADTVNQPVVTDDVAQSVTSNNSSNQQGTLTTVDASTTKETKTSANEVTSTATTETSPASTSASTSPLASSTSQGTTTTDTVTASTTTNGATDPAPTTPVAAEASNEPSNQVQPSSATDTTQTKPAHRPTMRLAAATTTDSDELIVGKDVTISDFSVTAANGKDEFENSHANIKFAMHADDPSALAGKRLTIQLDKVWYSLAASERQGSNPATISYQGQVIGTLNYGYSYDSVYITFNNRVKDYTKIDVQSDLVVAGTSQNTLPYKTYLYTSTQAKDGQTYYLTNDVTIGQQKYSSNLPSTIHYRALKSESVSSFTNLTTTSYDQYASELYAGTFYKTPDGIYYSQSSYYSGSNLYDKQNGQLGHLESHELYTGTDIITDHTQSYTATFDIDQTKLSPDSDSTLVPTKSYFLIKYRWDDEKLLPNTSDVYLDYSQTYSSTATANATVTKNSVIFNQLNGQSLVTQEVRINDSASRATNYIRQNGHLYLTPALFQQLRAVAESDQNLTEAVNTVKTTGKTAEIKLVNPIDTGFKATITTSDGKTKELSLLIDTIKYPIRTASTAPKGAILVAAQGKTAKVYHPGDQNIPAVVDQSQLTKTITRTINVHEPGKSVTTTKQTVTWTQSVSVVDGKDVTYNGDWKVQGDSQWASFTPIAVTGYTPSHAIVSAVTVNEQTKDQTVDITYTADAQTTHIKYVDKDNPSNVIHTTNVNGKTDQTVNVPNEVPAGWQLVSGQSVPKNVTFTATGYPDTTVKIEHKHTTVTPDHPKTTNDKLPDNPTKSYPSGVGQNDLNKTITRTIQVTDPRTQKVTTTTQPVHLTRTADVDEVSGAVTYGKWTTSEWPVFNTPNVPGYTPNQAQVAKTTVTDTTEDQTVKITYSANPQTTTVNYVDPNNQVIHSTPIKGVTDQTVSVPSEVPTGWKLSNGSTVPANLTFGPTGHPVVTVRIEHQHTTVTPDQPKTPSDKLPDNPTKNYPAGVATNDLNKTITRTINVTDPHTQKVTTTTQTVHLTRSATVDEVTGDVKYTNWSTGKWEGFTPSPIAGYTPSSPRVAAAVVTDQSKDAKVDITYTANPQSMQIVYVDHDQPATVVKTQTISGVTDQLVPVPNVIPVGWELTPGQKVPSGISFGPQGHDNMVIEIQHRHVTVTPDQPKTPADAFPDNPAEHYPTGVGADDLNKTITRKINVTDPHTQKVTTTTQTIHLTRTADVDEVSGAVVYSKWTTGTWDSFIPSPVAGYTPSVKAVNAVTVVDTTADQTVSITYTANPQTTQIEYVAPDDQIVHTTPIAGITDQTVDVPNELPAGWRLSDGQTIPTHLTFGPAGHPVVKVLIEHSHVTVTPDSPKTPSDTLPNNPSKPYPSGVAKDDLNKTITRTINVTDPHTQKVTTTTQTVHLTRTADVDEVSGAVVYSKWTTGTWDQFAVPVVAGYTPSVQAVNKVTVVDTTEDQTINITYTANPQSTQVEYVALDGQVVHTTPIAGATDQTVDVPNELPAGWRLSDGQTIPTQLTFGPDGYSMVKVLIEHGHVTVTPNSPKTPSDTLPDNPAAHYPTGVGADDLNKTITRTINVTDPHTQKVTTTTQTVHLTRTADVDEVTGDVEYSDWTTGEWAAFTTPAVAGYTPSAPQVAKITVTDQTKDATVDIKYTANPQQTVVNYVDGNGEVVHATKLTGTTDETIPVPNEVPAGWQLVGDEAIPTELTFTPDGYPDTTVKIEHSHVTVTPDSPKTPSDTLPNNPSKPYPSGVAKDDLNKTITRTINVVDPHSQKMTTTPQIVHLTRTADVDEVTGDVKYSDWTTGEWAAFQALEVAGYTPSAPQVAKVAVTDHTKDTTVTIKYTANAQSTTVNYVDGNGKIVHTTKLIGTTDQTIPVPNEVPAGWQLVDNETIPTKLTFTPNGYPTITVKVEHRHVTVTPDSPKTPSDTLPNNPTKPYPSGVAKDDLNKTITRTINVVDPHTQKVATTTQTVHLTRTADVDEVTGDVEYGAWTTGNWAAFTTPAVAGYTPSAAQVATVPVTSQSKDVTLTITYTADAHSTVVNYVDGNGEIVHATKLTGTTDQTIPVPNEVPAGWQLVGNETIPTEITFTPDGYPTLTVKVEHSHVTVTPDQPKTPSDTLPNNPTKHYPTGLATDDLNKTITRTINVVDPHTQKVTTTTQSVHLTRTADVDQVTGDVEYSAWTTGNWAAFTAPAVAGYTPAVPAVAALTVDAQTKDAIITITYTADQHTTRVNYVAGDGTVIHTTTLTGHTDETVTVPNEVPAGWKLVAGQTIPDHLTMTATGHDDLNVSITHAQTTVTPDAPKTPADMLPDNPTKGYPTGVAKNDLNKTVIRTINLIDPISGHTTTIKQTVALTRSATVDEVTGAVTYSAWSTDHWPAFQVPAIAGYQPSQGTVAKTTVEGTTLNQTVTITYQAQEQTIHVVLIDGDQILADVPLTGPTGTKVQIPLTSVDQSKYEIVGDVPHEHVMVANDDTIITIHLAHRTQTTVETRTVTRTINLTLPGGTTVTIPQVATLERSKTTDLATGQVTYGPWSTGHWDAYHAPSQAGYTAIPADISDKVVTADMQDQIITIVYHANTKPQATQPATPETTIPVAPAASKPTTQQQLPQTGDDEQTAMLLAGLALGTAQVSLLGIRNRKKQRN